MEDGAVQVGLVGRRGRGRKQEALAVRMQREHPIRETARFKRPAAPEPRGLAAERATSRHEWHHPDPPDTAKSGIEDLRTIPRPGRLSSALGRDPHGGAGPGKWADID